MVHGVETLGLGTSTFLEGAPAPRSAIQGSEEAEEGGLSRKMSIVQKIKATRKGNTSPPPPTLDASYNPVFKEGMFVERTESLPVNGGRERADSGASERGTSSILNRVKSLKISGGRKGKKVDDINS
jgi:Pal1 cell morphology protein